MKLLLMVTCLSNRQMEDKTLIGLCDFMSYMLYKVSNKENQRVHLFNYRKGINKI